MEIFEAGNLRRQIEMLQSQRTALGVQIMLREAEIAGCWAQRDNLADCIKKLEGRFLDLKKKETADEPEPEKG